MYDPRPTLIDRWLGLVFALALALWIVSVAVLTLAVVDVLSA
jgi:uncharacterized membrane protein required for colicin V production